MEVKRTRWWRRSHGDVGRGSLSRTGREREATRHGWSGVMEAGVDIVWHYWTNFPRGEEGGNIAILVSKSAAEAARMKLAYGALFRIHLAFAIVVAPDIKYPEMQRYKIVETMHVSWKGFNNPY